MQILLLRSSDSASFSEVFTAYAAEGLTLETPAFLPFTVANYVFKPVVNTKLPAILSHRRNTTVSLETYSFIYGVDRQIHNDEDRSTAVENF